MTQDEYEIGASSSERMIVLLGAIEEAIKSDTKVSPTAEWLGKRLNSIDESLNTIKNIVVFYAILTIIALVLGFYSRYF